MKTADIPDKVILEFLATQQGQWSSHCWGPLAEFLKQWPDKLAFSKLKTLHRRGLVGGCPCGCRGDWEITDKGLELVGQVRTSPYSGY